MLCSALAAPPLFAAAKEPEKPDREMLRLMEFLKEMEMLQQMEMMRDAHEAEYASPPSRGADLRKIPPPKTKGMQK
jgi:hypothetical protein